MKQLITALCLVWVMMTGCSKENSDQFYPYPTTQIKDTIWYNVIPPNAAVLQLDTLFDKDPLVDSIDITMGGTLFFTDSFKIQVPPHFCQGPGGATLPSNAKIKIEVNHLAKKGDFIRFARPTSSHDRALITGGSAFIKATYNGSEVSITPGASYNIRMRNKFSMTSPSNDMKVFYGNENANVPGGQNSFTWEPAPTPSQNGAANSLNIFVDSLGQSGYTLFPTRLRWVNCDYFSDTTQTRTRLAAHASSQYTNTNTAVYVVFKTMDIVLRMNADAANRIFTTPNSVYVGKEVTIVALSKLDNKLYLSTETVTVTPNMAIRLSPVEKTKAQIEAYLETL